MTNTKSAHLRPLLDYIQGFIDIMYNPQVKYIVWRYNGNMVAAIVHIKSSVKSEWYK